MAEFGVYAEGGFAFVTLAVLGLTAVAGFFTVLGFMPLLTDGFEIALGALPDTPVTAFFAPTGCDPIPGFGADLTAGIVFFTGAPGAFFCVDFAVVVNVLEGDFSDALYTLGLVTEVIPAVLLPLKPRGF